MDSIASLPDVDICHGATMAQRFLERDVATFHEACRWVQRLPYGSNLDFEHPFAIFEDGRGTCFTKHGAIARLAEELSLPVYKSLGFYRLTDDIVTGIDALLRPHGLPYLPQIHCFLESGSRRVDLTEGNAHGKNKTIEEYDFVIRVRPDSTRQELEQLYATYFARYADIEPRLAALDGARLRLLLEACHRQMSLRCSIMACCAW